MEVVVPEKYRAALAGGEIHTVTRIRRIDARDVPEWTSLGECGVCHVGSLVFTLGSLSQLSDHNLLLVNEIAGYFCNNPNCESGAVILMDVHTELREKIKSTSRQPVI